MDVAWEQASEMNESPTNGRDPNGERTQHVLAPKRSPTFVVDTNEEPVPSVPSGTPRLSASLRRRARGVIRASPSPQVRPTSIIEPETEHDPEPEREPMPQMTSVAMSPKPPAASKSNGNGSKLHSRRTFTNKTRPVVSP